jgi:hypothetical protein
MAGGEPMLELKSLLVEALLEARIIGLENRCFRFCVCVSSLRWHNRLLRRSNDERISHASIQYIGKVHLYDMGACFSS